MRVVDLFAGCGGLSSGFQQAGMELVAAYDSWLPAVTTYAVNFEHPIFRWDLQDSAVGEEIAHFAPDMIIGGPPCQDFSSAGKRDETLGRADLTIVFAQIVNTLRPQWVVMENVERARKSKAWRQAKADLLAADYGLTEIVLDASLCGVPQLRKRLFLIGELGGPPDALKPYLLKNLAKKPLTVKDYLGDKIEIAHYYRHPRSYARRGIFSVHEPSPTIRGVNRPIPGGYPGHSGDPVPVSDSLRPLTTLERSLIQTFPETFTFLGSKADVEQMIGNAVPPTLACYVACAIRDYCANESHGLMMQLQFAL